MHGLDKTTDLGFLLNKELEQLCLGPHECQLKFGAEVSISIQCDLKLDHDGEVFAITSERIEETSNLACLVGKKVSKFEIQDGGRLALSFTSHDKLTLFDSNRNFESYVIWNKGDFIAI